MIYALQKMPFIQTHMENFFSKLYTVLWAFALLFLLLFVAQRTDQSFIEFALRVGPFGAKEIFFLTTASYMLMHGAESIYRTALQLYDGLFKKKNNFDD